MNKNLFAYAFITLIAIFVIVLCVGWLLPGSPPKIDNDTFFEKFFTAVALVGTYLAKSPRES